MAGVLSITDTPKEMQLAKGRLYFDDNGILVGESDPYSELDVDTYIELMDAIDVMSRNQKQLFMIVAGEGAVLTKAARDLDVVERRARVTKAQAVVVASIATKLMAKLYGNFRKLPYPYRVFDDRDKAIEWLLAHR